MGGRVEPVKGMPDIFQEQAWLMKQLTELLADTAESYGCEEIRTPILERAELFKRTVGESSDIVGKEMYSFADKKGQKLVLRPEGTAAVVRALLSNGFDLRNRRLHRFWYAGPMFRYEKPQKGRRRQFHQFGIEIFGMDTFSACSECIAILWHCVDRVYARRSSVRRPVLHINHLGDAKARERYSEELRQWMRQVWDDLDEDSRNRIEINPLRIWDSKVAKTQQLLKDAPKLYDFLDGSAKEELANLERFARSFRGLEVKVNHSLVRGLDYYEGLVFEWVSDSLGAQDSLCGGGGYSSLVEELGGPETKACGFALGLDRLCLDILECGGEWLSETHAHWSPSSLELGFADGFSLFLRALIAETLKKLTKEAHSGLEPKSVKPTGFKHLRWYEANIRPRYITGDKIDSYKNGCEVDWVGLGRHDSDLVIRFPKICRTQRSRPGVILELVKFEAGKDLEIFVKKKDLGHQTLGIYQGIDQDQQVKEWIRRGLESIRRLES